MKFWHKNGLRYNANLRKILVSLAIICVSFVKVSINVDAQNTLSILELYKNSQSTRYKLVLSEKIYKVTDTNGEEIIPEQVNLNNILFENNGESVIRVFNKKLEFIEVNLDDATVIEDTIPPNILWKYKNTEDDTIYMGLHDDAGLYEITNIKQAESLRAILTKMPNDIIVSFNADDVNNKVEIYDVFGNKSEIDINDITLDVNMATKNVNGNKIALKISDSQNGITNVTYSNGEEIIAVGSVGLEDIYEINKGTTKVIVNHGTESTEVQLETDIKAPEVIRIWKNADDSIIMLETKDTQSALDKITIRKGTEEILKDINGLIKEQILSETIDNDVTHIYIYDIMGNRKKVAIDDIQVDTQVPQITIKYKNGEYIITANEQNSGVLELKIDELQLERYEDCPTDDVIKVVANLDGESNVKAYNGVGSESILNVNEAMSVRRRAYKNNLGTSISIEVSDQRGIVKITDQLGNVIERFFTSVEEVSTTYTTRKNTESINIFYKDDKSYTVNLEKLTDTPEVFDEVFDDNGLVTECKVYSPAGIKQIVYDTGKKQVFKKDLLDEIVVNCMDENDDDELEPVYVKVYDGVGNIVKINEDLA